MSDPDQVRGRARAILIVRLAWLAVGLTLTAALLASILVGLQTWSQSQRNAELIQSVQEVNDRLVDCTDPNGQCYRQAQEGTAEVVGAPQGPINTVTAYAAVCADQTGVQDADQIVECVLRLLRQRPPSQP